MALDPRGKAALALHRFGFGPRPGAVDTIASDPKGALLADLEREGAGLIRDAGLPNSAEAALRAEADRAQRKAAQMANRQERSAAKGISEALTMERSESMRAKKPPVAAGLYFAEAQVRADAAVQSEIGFAERLVWFWSNHFCIGLKKAQLRATAGAYEREAIRPHVLGLFSDMLLAAESHPAMLLYLDNVRSIGPNSPLGRKRGRGLNENLAREILELHTLGVRTVYTQADVTSFAKVITGWSVISPRHDPARGGEFKFVAQWHEPGAQTVLGKSYADTGVEQGRKVLGDLARHPAAARHIAAKLATHFVSDSPAPSLVERLAKRFHGTGGDLKEVARALVESNEAWEAPRIKLKRPGEWMIGAMRAAGLERVDNIRLVLKAQDMLGEPLWRPPSPKGFSDQSAEWFNSLAERLDVAVELSRRLDTTEHPSKLLDQVLGPLASANTRSAVARAEDRTQALTLLFMAPEFQQR